MTQTSQMRLWRGLALGGSALSLALPAGATGLAAPEAGLPVVLAQATGEGGEAGEAGLAAVADPDAAFAIRLALVDAHLRAAVEAASAGLVTEAMILAAHPEAEVMEDLRPDMAARGIADFSDRIDDLAAAIADEGGDAAVEAAYGAASAEILAAMTTPGVSDRAVFDALQALVKGAAIEFSEALEDGDEAGPLAALEAQGFLAAAREIAAQLSLSPDAATVTAARRAEAALEEAAILMSTAGDADPTILFAAAAQVEFAGLTLE